MSLCLQQMLHFIPRLTIFSTGLFLFRKERSILSPQGFDRGQLLQTQLIKGFLCSFVQITRMSAGAKHMADILCFYTSLLSIPQA